MLYQTVHTNESRGRDTHDGGVAFLMVIAHLMMGKLPLRGKILALSPRKELSPIITHDESPDFLICFSFVFFTRDQLFYTILYCHL